MLPVPPLPAAAARHGAELVKIHAFLYHIGLRLEQKALGDDCFLPGLELGPGVVYVDYDKLCWPGDILHEAGHLAVTPASQRAAVGSAALELPWPTQGEEIGALLWSYAALRHLDLTPEYVFHADGYKGDAGWLAEQFCSGNYIGMPILEWAGLSLSPERAQAEGKPAFPQMLQWLRD
ncbi:hypothetical protein V8J88_21110 [Massilia sp. W12]|uniref:hypothetical protein n=1 Tax=Massilia sp. W12 TaxID=3126507 RepID=UPI0030CBF563